MKFRSLTIKLLVSLLTTQPLLAAPGADVPAMAQAADLIVVGRASQTLNPRAPFLVTVDRVLKGAQTSPRVVVQSTRGYSSVQEGQYGIFFLQRQGSTYVVTDPIHPALVASPQRVLNQQKTTDVLGGLVGELTGVLTVSAATLTDPFKGVQGLVAADPVIQVQNVYYEAASALNSLPYAAAGPALQAIAGSNQVPARLWAGYSLFSMVGSNDESAKADYLASVQPILLNPQPDLEFSVSMLANATQGHIKSPAAVPALTTLLGSGNVDVRRAAASGLTNIATANVVAPLAKVALNDEDEDVRYYAVRGLTEVTGIGTSPTIAGFQQNEDEMLQFWRTWAQSNVR